MKKLFLIICFSLCFVLTHPCPASVSTMEEAVEAQKEPQPLVSTTPSGLPDPQNIEQVRNFFKQRFENAIVSDAADLGDLNKTSSMDIQHSAEYIENMKEQKKSVFEKIYDSMVGRLNEKEVQFSPDTVFYEQIKPTEEQPGQALPNISVVQVKLPNGTEIVAPAREHIPYFLASYQILPTGMIDVEEDIVVIANGKHLKHGLVKSMPKFTTSRDGIKKKIELTLLSVSINHQDIAYKLQEIGNTIVFVPKEKYILEPGIYTYHFHYLLDRKLWYYDTFTEFYADLAGGYNGLVTTSANAIVSVPDGRTFLSQLAMAGSVGNLSGERTVIAQLSPNALGFASIQPLTQNESMHILVSLDKNIFNTPSLSRRFVWLITDYGDIIFSIFGFLVIYISYYLSWKWIKQNKSRLKVRFKQTAAMNRYILNGTYDQRSFISTILELVRHNVIDLKKDGPLYFIVKKTDSLKSLPAGLKLIMKNLFSKMDTSVDISAKNKLRFERAFNQHQNYIQKYFKFLAWRLNIYYLIFSIGMFILTLYAISYVALNPLETMMILTFSSLIIAFYLWILRYPFAKKWLRYIVRFLDVFFIISTILIVSVYIHLMAALILALCIDVIIEYSSRFSAKNGLMKNKTNEISGLYQYLKSNVQRVTLPKEFFSQQPNIFAFELENLYIPLVQTNTDSRLEIAQELLAVL